MDQVNVIHDSHSSEFRNPFGAVKIGTKVQVLITTNRECNIYINIINFYNNRIEAQMEKEELLADKDNFKYKYTIDTTELLGVNYYYFRLEFNGQEMFYGNNNECCGGIGQLYNYNPKAYQLTVHNVRDIPKWYQEGVIYQIFVDRFYNGNENGQVLNPKKNTFIYGCWYDKPMYIKECNGSVVRWDFYGGNLLGVKKKLPYFKKLGINIIYFNPIFESVSCHKYDTADYENIDSMFGNNSDFEDLCEEALLYDIRIVLDGVFSHTGDDSKYFNKYGTFDTVGAAQSLSSKYYSWYKFKDYPNYYDSWWGFSNMPEVDELNSNYLDYIIRGENSIIETWLKRGASGWRLDVADELPDKFIKLLKAKMREVKGDSILIGEVWEDASNKISYSKKREYLFGEELDSVTNYPIRQLIIEYIKKGICVEWFIKRYLSLLENYPKDSFYSTMNLVGNHDTERILTVFENKIELLKLSVAIQMTLPGVPLIYYGDEVGLNGGKDPENRKAYPWGRENKELLDFYENLINIRRTQKCLIYGEIKFGNTHNNILCYERSYGKDRIIVLINVNDKTIDYEVKDISTTVIDLLTNETFHYSIDKCLSLKLEANAYKILKIL